MRIGVITDLHFGREASYQGKLRKLGRLAPEAARRFVEAMNRDFRPDLVFHLGDMVQDMTLEEDKVHAAQCLEILAGLDAPIYHVVGNHDLIKLLPEDVIGLWTRHTPHMAALVSPEEPRLHYHLKLPGWDFLALHTREQTDHYIWMDEPQLAWLEQTLAACVNPVVVWMHHSAADQDTAGNWWFAKHPHLALVRERARLRGLLEASGKVRAVINGHLHWNRCDWHGGIPYMTVTSPIENFDNADPPAPTWAWGELVLQPDGGSLRVVGRDPAAWSWGLV
jgi:3',5'-cyclic AMP phosphodiesterase CpdA